MACGTAFAALHDHRGRLLTWQQVSLLTAVRAHEIVFDRGPSTLGVADLLQLRPTVARAGFERLERRGLVVQSGAFGAMRGWGRRRLVELTPAGRRIFG